MFSPQRAGLALALLVSCSEDRAIDSASVKSAISPGDPLDGLTPEQLALFFFGEDEFVRERVPSDGLGPVFIERSCLACHAQGGIGGADDLTDPNHFVQRFATINAAGAYDPLAAFGGDVLQTRSIAGEVAGCNVAPESIPSVATIHSTRNPLPMFGIGLMAAIPQATILAGAIDRGDGVHGRPNLDATGKAGRFGWKAQTNDLAPFNGAAANGTMGLTSPFAPGEQNPSGSPAPAGCTNADLGASSPNDPIGESLLAITAWEIMLAPVEPAKKINGTRAHGQELFEEIGCAKCHTPSMQTGDFSMPLVGGGTMFVDAVSNKTAHLYSDLLLHDMGEGLDEQVTMRQARGRDFRTAPLWGIQLRTRFLHDGRATSIHDAIVEHGGEATIIRDRYLALDPNDQRALRRFVENL